MHEAMKGLMRRIEAITQAHQAARVVGVSVWMGALSHMSPAHLADHFEAASGGTIAEGAELRATFSDDVHHANAQDILLESIEVET